MMNTTDTQPTKVSFEEAAAMITDGKQVHTFRSAPNALLGADWKRDELLAALRKYPCELAGPMATKMKHGLVMHDEHGPLFIEIKQA